MRDRETLLREARELARSRPTQDAMEAFVAGLEPEEKEDVIEAFHLVLGMMSDDMVMLREALRKALRQTLDRCASLVTRLQELGVIEQNVLRGDDNVDPHSAG